MKIIPLSKEEAKKYVDNTVSIFNIITRSDSFNFPGSAYENFLLNWYKKLGINANVPQYKINEEITKVMGFEPQFRALYGSENYRNAVWGVRLNDNRTSLLFVFNSKKGTAIQVHSSVNAEKINNFLVWLMR